MEYLHRNNTIDCGFWQYYDKKFYTVVRYLFLQKNVTAKRAKLRLHAKIS